MDKIEIPNSIKEKTTNCERDFKCLTGDHSCMCEVLENTDRCSIKIKTKPDAPCKYYVSPFRTCECPTRAVIYRTYKM